MKITIDYLNPEAIIRNNTLENSELLWYIRTKSYKSDVLEEDMKNAAVSHIVDRIILDNVQLSTKDDVENFIEFLNKSKESFQNQKTLKN